MKASKARRAIRKRISDLAPKASSGELLQLAEAESKLRYGAHGRTIYDYRIHRERELKKDVGFDG